MTPEPIARHVVMLNKAYPPWLGGIETHVRDTSEALSARGWKVTALVCHEGLAREQEERNGVTVIRVARWGTLWSQPLTLGYSRQLRRLQPDLVHVHVPFPLGWIAALRLPATIPVICTWHSEIIRQRAALWLLSPLEQGFLRRCARIIATSPELLQSSQALQNHRERCTAIPLALPPGPAASEEEQGRIEERIKQQWPGQRVLFVGRLVAYKGLPVLLQAMREIPAHLLIAGDGPLRDSLERQARAEVHAERIHFLGQVSEEEKRGLYRTADVLVLPAVQRSEAFGYVLLEAMREECPVITTDLPTGVRWVNRHEETGLVTPPGDVEALAGAIRRILGDEALRRRLGENAARRVKTDFRFEETIDQLEEIYREALRTHPPDLPPEDESSR